MKIAPSLLISLLFTPIFFLGCNSMVSKKNDFLDFYLGMSKDEFESVIDTLLKTDIIEKTNASWNYQYKYTFHFIDKQVDSQFGGTFEDDVLSAIQIRLGSATEIRTPSSFGRTTISNEYRISNDDFKNILSLYKRVYGNPSRIDRSWSDYWGNSYFWDFKDKVIRLYDGNTLTSTHRKDASILYEFSENEIERRKREKYMKTLQDI